MSSLFVVVSAVPGSDSAPNKYSWNEEIVHELTMWSGVGKDGKRVPEKPTDPDACWRWSPGLKFLLSFPRLHASPLCGLSSNIESSVTVFWIPRQNCPLGTGRPMGFCTLSTPAYHTITCDIHYTHPPVPCAVVTCVICYSDIHI